MRLYYACEHIYGQHVQDKDGHSICNVYRFPTAQQRDHWTADSPTDYSTCAGYREALRHDSPEVRYARSNRAIMDREDWTQ